MNWDRNRWDFGGNRPDYKHTHEAYSNLIHPGSEVMTSNSLVGKLINKALKL